MSSVLGVMGTGEIIGAEPWRKLRYAWPIPAMAETGGRADRFACAANEGVGIYWEVFTFRCTFGYRTVIHRHVSCGFPWYAGSADAVDFATTEAG